jgi:hypothetical protein
LIHGEPTPPPAPKASIKDMTAAEFLDWAVSAMQMSDGKGMDLHFVTKFGEVARLVMVLDEDPKFKHTQH